MDWLFPTLGFGVASALLPILNAEVYLAALAANQSVPVWPLAVAAALGQMVGKVVYYLVGRSSLGWARVRRYTDRPRFQDALERWRGKLHDRPWLAAAVVLASSVVGIPPLAVVSVLAGSLRTSLTMFFLVGFVGRTLRFASLLGATDWFFS